MLNQLSTLSNTLVGTGRSYSYRSFILFVNFVITLHKLFQPYGDSFTITQKKIFACEWIRAQELLTSITFFGDIATKIFDVSAICFFENMIIGQTLQTAHTFLYIVSCIPGSDNTSRRCVRGGVRWDDAKDSGAAKIVYRTPGTSAV